MGATSGNLFTDIQHGIARLSFGHPASNSLPGHLLRRLESELDRLSQLDSVKLIVLLSEGERAFCAGASFDELLEVEAQEQAERFFAGFAGVINAMRRCSKVIVGRIHGKAVGGGVGLAAACDYCFATEAASIKLSELSIGIGPFVIAPALERKMGVGALAELSLAPKDWKSAYWAQEKGLYARVFEKTSDMDVALEELSSELASYHPEALAAMKKMLWEGTAHWKELLPERARISGKLVLSPFTKSALERFKNK